MKYKKSFILKDKILKNIKINPNRTLEEIGEICMVSKRTVIRYTNELKEEGLLRRIGAKKNGIWEVIGDANCI